MAKTSLFSYSVMAVTKALIPIVASPSCPPFLKETGTATTASERTPSTDPATSVVIKGASSSPAPSVRNSTTNAASTLLSQDYLPVYGNAQHANTSQSLDLESTKIAPPLQEVLALPGSEVCRRTPWLFVA